MSGPEQQAAQDGTPSQVTSEVGVAVDPDTAFVVFTGELDLWWVRGPINHYAGGRTVAMRCEPGVGGRLLEVYDDSTGDALELATITAWEPGKRLAWRSSLDDVRTEVTFEATAAGTLVRVVATIPAGGQDRGIPIIGIDNLPGSLPIETYDLPRHCILLFGQEGPGLSPEAQEASAAILDIAQFGSTRSLNAGAAGAIAMHAWVRRHVFDQRAGHQ